MVIFVGCSSAPRFAATQFTQYSDFWPGPRDGVDHVWARVGLREPERLANKLAKYDTVIIEPIIVVKAEKSASEELDADEIAALIQFTEQQLHNKVAQYKSVVKAPTGRTLRLQVALSNVETPNPILAVTSSVLPFGLGISAISKLATGEHTNVGAASIELLVSDAQTDAPLFAVIDRQAGNKDFSTMIDSLDDAKDAIRWWFERLGRTLDGVMYTQAT
ncbi:DUF3313 domain-containing protein [Vibrio sp. SM6]|uniref:DUF3313 domain-containing protein n=1 Tax=Vibrio agarilyticus TaxID=2726741 RepID=A0A7X8YIF6_9VIBR|nr:DUF3313 domain-containing protein [Vibrio agarilyticus]NLS14560.1 DUF3313 domain-containing protein [Vibrio agarilyticus]